MSDYLSELPVELLHIIFDDLSMDDILSSVCFVNKRLRTICLIYPRFHFDFTSSAKKKEQFELVCAHLPHVPSQILTVTFSKSYDHHLTHKITCFFSRFNTINDTFSKLHSITLDAIDLETWHLINCRLTSLPSLVSLSIVCSNLYHSRVASTVSKLLHQLLYDSHTLKRLSVEAWAWFLDPFIVDSHPNAKRSLIEHLTLEGIQVQLKSLLEVTPALKELDVKLKAFQFKSDTRLQSPPTMRNLTIKMDEVTLKEIEYMFYSLTQLTHFTIISREVQYDMADGIAWARLLKTVVTFKFSFTFDHYTVRPSTSSIDLASFRTPFWLEEKQWYVTYDRCIDTGFSLLYSNPYCFNDYPLHYMKGFITTESTKQTSTSFSHIDDLIADYDYPIDRELHRRVTNITRSSLVDCGTSLKTKLDYATTYLDLSQVTLFSAFRCETDMTNDVFVRFLQSLPRLRSLHLSIVLVKLLFVHQWPHINYLYLSSKTPDCSEPLTLYETDAFCRSFTHIERLDISTNTFSDLSRFFKNIMSTLSSIYISRNVNESITDNDRLIQQDWIEKNTQLRNFHYSYDKYNRVHLWL